MNRSAAPIAPLHFRSTMLASALWLAFGPGFAQTASSVTPDDIRRDLYTPGSRLAVGVGHVFGDNRRFGQWTGLTEEGPVLLLDMNLVRREEQTGTWMKLTGRNLGFENREMSFAHERQADWAYSISGGRLTRHEPLIVNTGLAGVGSALQVVSAAAPKRDLDLRIDHDIAAVGARKFVTGNFDVELGLKQDDTHGARLFGRGTSNVMEFLTEPIDRTTRHWHASANYAGRTVQFSGGYAGSAYDNHVPVLRSTGGNSAPTAFGPQWVMAMPLSNTSHQLHASGGLNFSKTGRLSVKLSRTEARQDEIFDPAFTRLAGTPDSLNAKVVTTLGFAELSTRPTRRLNLGATLRFEDRDDQTPQTRWLANINPTVGGSFSTAGHSGLNKPRSIKQLKSGVEAGYQLDGGYKVGAGIDRDLSEYNAPDNFRRVALRERLGETSTRLEFKRMGSEVLNGSVALVHSERTGSTYLPDTFDPNARTNTVNVLMFADRIRDKLRLATDWVAAEQVSIQFVAEGSRDRYGSRAMGPRTGSARFASVDALYQLNDKWSLNGWVSHERTHSVQTQRSDPTATGAPAAGFNTEWAADISYATNALGVGVKGLARANLTVGAELNVSLDTVEHDQAKIGGTGTLPVVSLPRMHFRQTGLKLYADHALDRHSGLRFEVLYDRRAHNDWTWVNWTYGGSPSIALASRNSDGTTVTDPSRDRVGFVGVKYIVRWR